MLLGARIASMAGGGSGPTPPTEYWGLHFVAEEAGAQIGMTNVGSPDAVTLEYSTDDGSTWATFTPGTTTVTLAAVGDTACFRAGSGGNTKIGKGDNDYRKFTVSKPCACHGNIMSLLDGTDDATATAATMANYCFRCLFRECAGLTSMPELPATALVPNCYDNMFRGCTSLTVVDNIAATYCSSTSMRSMFIGCTSIVRAVLKVDSTSGTYNGMNYCFSGCSSLNDFTTYLPRWQNDIYGDCTINWLDGVAATGTFRCPATLDTSASNRNVSRCPSGWTVVNI